MIDAGGQARRYTSGFGIVVCQFLATFITGGGMPYLTLTVDAFIFGALVNVVVYVIEYVLRDATSS